MLLAASKNTRPVQIMRPSFLRALKASGGAPSRVSDLIGDLFTTRRHEYLQAPHPFRTYPDAQLPLDLKGSTEDDTVSPAHAKH